MNSSDLINRIKAECTARANPANVAKYQRYFKEPFQSYGLTNPEVSALVKSLLQTPGMTLDILLEAAPELIRSHKYEETTIPMLLLNGMHKQYHRGVFDEIGKWYDIGIDNWAEADTMGMFIIPRFLKMQLIHFTDLADWRTGTNKFKRRTAPVSLIKQIKLEKATLDLLPYFQFVEPLIHDPAREVHQGVGWFLREAWKIRPEVTEDFLMVHKETAPRLMMQYACEKMEKEARERFKRQKAKGKRQKAKGKSEG